MQLSNKVVNGLVSILAVIVIAFALGSSDCFGNEEGEGGSASCNDDEFSCGDPVGGPACCAIGKSCCFGYNLCCDEDLPHLGTQRSDGTKMCYQNLQGEGVTWDLIIVCGKPT